jgi:hypothetical protein
MKESKSFERGSQIKIKKKILLHIFRFKGVIQYFYLAIPLLTRTAQQFSLSFEKLRLLRCRNTSLIIIELHLNGGDNK